MECKECKYFEGYDWSDGTPECTYEDENGGCGYESCPYQDVSTVKNNGIKIEIDSGFMSEYIKHTISNTIATNARSQAETTITYLVKDNLKDMILEESKKQVSEIVSKEIAEFMAADITVGGGWNEPSRKLSRNDYLSECITQQMEAQIKKRDGMKRYAEAEVKSAIDAFERKLKDEVNAQVKTYFDAATRQVLTANVVSMLMDNETYKRLSDSMQHFLPDNK